MSVTPAWYVPPAERARFAAFPERVLHAGRAIPFAFPDASLAEIERLARALARGGEVLAAHPLDARIRALDVASRRLRAPGEPLRAELLERSSLAAGRAPAMMAHSLDHLLGKLEAAASRRVLEGALGDLRALREFVPSSVFGRRRRAVAPRLTLHVLAGNTPWAGIESLAAAVLAGSASVLKPASGDPGSIGVFVHALAETDPVLGDALAVLYWPVGSEANEEAIIAEADAVVAFGGDVSVGEWSRRLSWRIASGRVVFVPRGHRFSVAWIGAAALADPLPLAEKLSLDLAFEDQEGCLSPQAIYIEERDGGAVDQFAAALAAALETRERQWPLGGEASLVHHGAAEVQQVRGAAELRGAIVLAPSGSTRWTVIVEARAEFEPPPAGRCAWIRRVLHIEDASHALQAARGAIATIGIAGFEDPARAAAVAGEAASLRAARVCPIGRMQEPPAGWNHDGAPDLAALVRWIEWEEAT
jgi:hypothetical protein